MKFFHTKMKVLSKEYFKDAAQITKMIETPYYTRKISEYTRTLLGQVDKFKKLTNLLRTAII